VNSIEIQTERPFYAPGEQVNGKIYITLLQAATVDEFNFDIYGKSIYHIGDLDKVLPEEGKRHNPEFTKKGLLLRGNASLFQNKGTLL
jgi:hypothetical protein